MTFFRQHDAIQIDQSASRCKLDPNPVLYVVSIHPEGVLYAATPDGFSVSGHFHDHTAILLCGECEADRAAWFDWQGAPYCEACSPKDRIPVRPDPSAILHCACGDAMDAARVCGIWTMAGVAAEYRQCLHCHSHRPWAPKSVVEGRKVQLYLDPETSEIAGEWDNLMDALDADPGVESAQLIRNGVTLATAIRAPTGDLGWMVNAPTIELPLAMAVESGNQGSSRSEPKENPS